MLIFLTVVCGVVVYALGYHHGTTDTMRELRRSQGHNE
jgi:hypothetical protein